MFTYLMRERWRRARLAKQLAVAFEEELRAVAFYYAPTHSPTVGGFSSQTFDTLFAAMAEAMPDTLARGLMRYHWRMKYLAHSPLLHHESVQEMEEIRDELLKRLGAFRNQWTLRLSLVRRERRRDVSPWG